MLRILSFCFLLLTASFHLGFAQGTAIRGRVVDGSNKGPLPGASVAIAGEIAGTSTDDNGVFTLRVNQQGAKVVVITFMGFEPLRVNVDIKDRDIDLGTLELGTDATAIEVVQVRGSLEGQQRALNQQRMADNIKNIISADLIGRFPDLNVAEAMQRVPGVNIQRDKGEGSTVSIRGTPQHFTTIQINGEQIPSVQQSGTRNEALDLIPADQLGSMEITKAPTPDMDGDAIGGVINLKTPVARRLALGIRAEGAMGYNDISGAANGIGKLRLDKRFFADDKNPIGKLGLILSASYYSTDNAEDRIDAVWQGIPRPIENLGESVIVMDNYQFRHAKNVRERIGATATLDYRFNDNHEVVFNYMYNRREDNDLRNRLRFDMNNGQFHTLDSIGNGRVRRDINIWDELKTNHSFGLQGYHTLHAWKIDWSANYVLSDRVFTSDRGDFATNVSSGGTTIVADNPGGIYADVPNLRPASFEQNMYDPFFYREFRRYEEDYETTDATNMVGRIDLTRFVDLWNKYPAYIKFGGKVRSQTNSKYRNNQVLGFNDPNNILNRNESFLRVLSLKEPVNFLKTDYRFGPLIGRPQFEGYIDDIRLFLTETDDAWDSRRISLNDTYDAFEDIYSAYFLGRTQIDKLMILAGVRYEYNDVRYNAFEVFRVGTDVRGVPISGGNEYDFLMPHLHMKYSLDDYTAIRMSALMNYARPNFVDIVPFVNYDTDAVTLRLGNPDLQPAKAWNFDLMFEKYFSNVGILSVGAYFKDIDKFQFSRIDPSLATDFPGYPGTAGFIFRQEQNGEKARVMGIEVNAVRSLDFLPGFFRYLNADFNYTYAYSDAFTNDRTGISLPGQAPHTFNVSLALDYKGFAARIMGNYNGTFVSSLASSSQDDIYQEHRFHVDANASYTLNQRWRIFGEWVNITNAPSIRYQGERERISRISYYGWWTRIGLGFRL